MSDFLFQRLASGGGGPAVVHGDRSTSHNELLARTNAFCEQLTGRVDAGTVVSFSGDYSVDAVALFLALLRLRTIIVPLSSDSRAHFNEYREIAEVELQIEVDGDELVLEDTGREAGAELYQRLRAADAPGLVLFSSGSTGKSKAIVQDLARLIEKFQKPGKAQRMLIFLQLDHIGGVNSLLYSLANAGTLVTPLSRAPDAIAAAVEKHRVELLPTSPTFLN
ncbi:MAG: AMP-binding protein, partial [Pseudomonadota bacterium]